MKMDFHSYFSDDSAQYSLVKQTNNTYILQYYHKIVIYVIRGVELDKLRGVVIKLGIFNVCDITKN